MKTSTKWLIGGISALALGVGGWLIWRNIRKKKEANNKQLPPPHDDPTQYGPLYDPTANGQQDTVTEWGESDAGVYEYHAPEEADIHIDQETHQATNYFEMPDENINVKISSSINKNSVPAIVNALDLPKESIDIDGNYQKSLNDYMLTTSPSDFGPDYVGVSVCLDTYGIDLLNGNFTTAQKAVMCNLAGTVFVADAYMQYKPRLKSWLQAVASM